MSSRRTPGPITTVVRGHARIVASSFSANSISQRLWVPAFAGTTRGWFRRRSLLLRAVIAERPVARIELRLDAAAVAAEGRHIGAARFRGEGESLDFGAGAHRGAGAHDLHGTMHRALVELLQLVWHL